MKLDFKRIMSFVLAFVMLFSSLIMVNVVSVSAAAANTSFKLTADDLNSESTAPGEKAAAAGFTQVAPRKDSSALADLDSKVTNNLGVFTKQLFVKKGSYKFTTSVSGTVKVYAYFTSSGRSITISDGTNHTSIPQTYVKNQGEMGSLDVTVSPEATKEITITTSHDTGIYMLGIDFEADGGGSTGGTKYTWSLDPECIQALKDGGIDTDKITFAEEQTDIIYNKILYDADDYMIDPKYEHLTADKSGVVTVSEQDKTVKVTLTKDNFLHCSPVTFKIDGANIEGAQVGGEAVTGRILRISCNNSDHNHKVFAVRLANTGTDDGAVAVINSDGTETPASQIYLAEDCTYDMTIVGGTLDKTTFNPKTENYEFSAAFQPASLQAVTAATGEIDLTQGLVAIDRTENIYSGAVIGNGAFEVIADSNGHTVTMLRNLEGVEDPDEAKIIAVSLATVDDAADGALEFEVDGNVKATFTYSAEGDGVKAYPGISKYSGDTSSITNMLEDVSHDSTTESTFSVELTEGEYIVYNAGGQKEDAGYVRLTKANFEKSETNPGPEGPTGSAVYEHYADASDATANGAEGQTDASVFTKNAPTGNKPLSPAGKAVINGKTYTLNYYAQTSVEGANIEIAVPQNMNDAVLYLYMSSNTNSARSLKLTADGDEKQIQSAVNDRTFKLVEFDGLQAGKTYTLTAYDGDAFTSTKHIQIALMVLAGNAGPSETHTIKVSGTNSTGEDVKINIGSTGLSFQTGADAEFTDVEVADVPVGTYELTADAKYDLTGTTSIDVKSTEAGGEETQTFTGVAVAKAAVKTTIKGKVDLTTNYEYVNHDSKDQIGKTDSDNGYKENITGNKNNVKEDVTGATVTVTKGGKSATGTVNADGTYEVVFPEDDAVAADLAEYTVRVSGTGIPAGTQNTSKTVSVEPGGTVTTDADFALNTPTYKVRFETNIKGYKFDIIIKKDGTEVFRLTDNTYHYSVKPEGALSDNARIESITHTIMMPEGNYTIEKGTQHDDGIFTLADEKGSALTSFTVKRSSATASNSTRGIQVEEIYLKSEIKSDVIDALIANEGKVSGSVVRGTYRFVAPTTQTSVAAAQCKYTLGSNPNPENDGKGIYAEGVYAAKNDADTSFNYGTDGRIDIGSDAAGDNLQGYVIFHIAKDESFLTKIDTAAQPCLLINLDTREVMTIDSLYSQSTIMLEGDSSDGTYYAIARIGESKAHATSVLFDLSSPFKVATENIQPYTGDLGDAVEISNAALIIGTYDESGDTAGSSSLEDYDRFAIFVSANKDLLNYDHINSINETEIKFEQKPATEGAGNDYVISTDEPQNYNSPNVLSFEKQSGSLEGNVLGEQTDTLFEKIVITVDNIKEINNGYGYALIVNSLTPGQQYYAVGAALTSTSEGAKWLIQDTDAAQFSVD